MTTKTVAVAKGRASTQLKAGENRNPGGLTKDEREARDPSSSRYSANCGNAASCSNAPLASERASSSSSNWAQTSSNCPAQ